MDSADLLCDTKGSLDRAGRLRLYGQVHGAPTPTHCATPPVEQGQAHPKLLAHLHGIYFHGIYSRIAGSQTDRQTECVSVCLRQRQTHTQTDTERHTHTDCAWNLRKLVVPVSSPICKDDNLVRLVLWSLSPDKMAHHTSMCASNNSRGASRRSDGQHLKFIKAIHHKTHGWQDRRGISLVCARQWIEDALLGATKGKTKGQQLRQT